jgi:hypothetical protein
MVQHKQYGSRAHQPREFRRGSYIIATNLGSEESHPKCYQRKALALLLDMGHIDSKLISSSSVISDTLSWNQMATAIEYLKQTSCQASSRSAPILGSDGILFHFVNKVLSRFLAASPRHHQLPAPLSVVTPIPGYLFRLLGFLYSFPAWLSRCVFLWQAYKLGVTLELVAH